MAFDWKIEASKTISGQTVSSSLQKYGFRSEIFDDFGDDRLEDHLKGLIIESLIEWEVDGVVRAWIFADIIDMSCSREVVLEFVEGAGHDSVGQVERFFNSVAVVDVDVDVQHALVGLQQLQNGQHAIIDIAKPWCFWLLGVMQAARPIDPVGEFSLPQQGRSGCVSKTIPMDPLV